MRRRLAIALLFLALAGSSSPAAAQDLALVNTDPQGVAIHGYDAVAYFTQGAAVPGRPEFRHRWRGATWHFADAANLARFESDPARFAPQYGGFCAYAASQGHLADVDPEAWTILNGKLYLNYSKRVRAIWRPRAEELIVAADEFWPELVERHARR